MECIPLLLITTNRFHHGILMHACKVFWPCSSPFFSYPFTLMAFLFPKSLPSTSMSFKNLDIHMRENTVFIFLQMTYFTVYDDLQPTPAFAQETQFHPSYGWIQLHCLYSTYSVSTHLSTDGIQTDDNLSLVNRAPINMGMQICLLYSDFDSFGNIHRSN